MQVLEVPGSKNDASYSEKGAVSQESSSTTDSTEMSSSSQLNILAAAGIASEDEVKNTSPMNSISSSQHPSSEISSKRSKVEDQVNTSQSEQTTPLSAVSTSGATEPNFTSSVALDTVSKSSSTDATTSVASESVPQTSVSGTQPTESNIAEQQRTAMDVKMLRAGNFALLSTHKKRAKSILV